MHANRLMPNIYRKKLLAFTICLMSYKFLLLGNRMILGNLHESPVTAAGKS